jgi:hypothetical protein
MTDGQPVTEWRKSSLSFSNGACVEAGNGLGVTVVRDSQLGDASTVLEFAPAAWAVFTRGLRP